MAASQPCSVWPRPKARLVISTPTDVEIANAFAQQKEEFDRAGTALAEATPILRERLIASRRRELIADWVADLRRRTDVILLVQ